MTRQRVKSGKGVGMLHDLGVVTPSVVVGTAFLAGVFFFLRGQMGTARGRGPDAAEEDDIRDEEGNAGPADVGAGVSRERGEG